MRTVTKKELRKRIELLEARCAALEAQLAGNPYRIKINPVEPPGGTGVQPWNPFPNTWTARFQNVS